MAVLTVMASSMVVTLVLGFRAGGYVLAASLGLAGLVRAMLPPKYCLGLLVRGRGFDVTTTTILAVSIAFLTATVPG